jgi:hypothetical protein
MSDKKSQDALQKKAIGSLPKEIREHITILPMVSPEDGYDNNVAIVGRNIERSLSQCDHALFIGEWEQDRECSIYHRAACAFSIPCWYYVDYFR